MRKWAKLSLVGILLVSAICLTTCSMRIRYVYRPASDQIFLVPAGSEITAPDGGKIITDGAAGRITVDAICVPVPSVLLSEDRFLRLYREAIGEPYPDGQSST